MPGLGLQTVCVLKEETLHERNLQNSAELEVILAHGSGSSAMGVLQLSKIPHMVTSHQVNIL